VLGVVLTLAGVGLAVVALIPARSSIDASLVALVLVIPVTIGVAVGGFPVVPVGVATGFLAFDFFFIPPYYTLRVVPAGHWVSLAVYTAVGLIVGGVVAQAQGARADAEDREAELLLLHELARAVSDAEGLDAGLHAVARLAKLRFDLPTVGVFLTRKEPDFGLQAVAIEGAPFPERDLRSLVAALPLHDVAEVAGAPGLVAAPLPTSAGAAGVLVAAVGENQLDAGRRRLLSLFATQAGAAVERSRLAEETSRSRTLAEVDRLRSSLMGAVSHDLRTPLASIKASVSDLADPDVHFDDADRRMLLATIEEETDRLTRLVANLLDMGRIEAGALVPNKAATPIDELIETVLVRLAKLLDGPISLDIPNDLLLVDIDYVMVEQVLANLLENVARHCPPNTAVAIAVVPIGSWAEIRVSDDGPGIAPADRDRIFQLFYRGGGVGGTGMGLAICQGIVEAHGGRMWVEQAPAGGSTFVFRLPLWSPPAKNTPKADRSEVDAHP